jgi:hypothetical protein
MRACLLDGIVVPREVGALKLRWNPASLIVTMRPLDIFDVKRIRRCLGWCKELHFIVIVRDPRMLVTSRHKSVPSDFFQGYDQSYFISRKGVSYTNPGVIKTFDAIREARKIPGLNITVVRYEDIATDPDGVQKSLDSLGVAWKGRFSDCLTADVPARQMLPLRDAPLVQHGTTASWQIEDDSAPRIVQQFTGEPRLFEFLVEWNYETDRRWFDDLVAKHGPYVAPRGTIIGFYTTGTYYEKEALRLAHSAATLGLKPLLTGMSSTGSWVRNASMKARFLLEQRRSLSGPLLYVDVDAILRADPWAALMVGDTDMAAHFNRSGELLSGTLFINDTQGSRELLERWTAACEANPEEWDQRLLQRVINEDEASPAPRFKVCRLPASFCWIFDSVGNESYNDRIIIEQLQASRESLRQGRGRFRRMSRRLKRRLDRIEAIERELRFHH